MVAFNKDPAAECEYAYKVFLKNGGNAIVSGKCKYIGGNASIKGERSGELSVNNLGVFFNGRKNGCYFYLPAEKILRAKFETGEQVSKNAFFSRLLAVSGFIFAYKKKTREKHMYLTIDYIQSGSENVVLLETPLANEFVSAIAKVRQEVSEKKEKEREKDTDKEKEKIPEQSKSVSELMIELNELYALGILTAEEFSVKKRELLSRI
jgi:hypothetical protein